MIKKVSANVKTSSFPKKIKAKLKETNLALYKKVKESPFLDSFVKHSKESAPALLLVTGVMSVVEHSTKEIKLTKAFKNNLFSFFAPVIVASSTVLSLIENKKPSKSSK